MHWIVACTLFNNRVKRMHIWKLIFIRCKLKPVWNWICEFFLSLFSIFFISSARTLAEYCVRSFRRVIIASRGHSKNAVFEPLKFNTFRDNVCYEMRRRNEKQQKSLLSEDWRRLDERSIALHCEIRKRLLLVILFQQVWTLNWFLLHLDGNSFLHSIIRISGSINWQQMIYKYW